MSYIPRSKTILLVRRALHEFLDDKCWSLAASVAYYGFLSLFPLILLLVAVFSPILQSPELQDQLLAQVGSYLPGARNMVLDVIQGVVLARGPIGVISGLTLLWSASGIFGATSDAVNAAWGVKKARPFVKQSALNLAMVAAAGIFFFLSMSLTGAFHLLSSAASALIGAFPLNAVWGLVGILLPFLFSLAIFLLVYKVLPNTWVSWREALVGAVVAAMLFELVKNIFAWYAQNLANYNLVYGSVGTVVVLLTWIYFSAAIMLLGAELSAQYAFQRRRRVEERFASHGPERSVSTGLAMALGLFTLTATIIKSIGYVKAEKGSRRGLQRILGRLP